MFLLVIYRFPLFLSICYIRGDYLFYHSVREIVYVSALRRKILYFCFFFLTSEAALSAIFQTKRTKRLVSIRIKARTTFFKSSEVVKLRKSDRQSDLTSVSNFPAWYRWKIFTDSSMNFQGFLVLHFFFACLVIKGVPGDPARQGVFRGIPGCPEGAPVCSGPVLGFTVSRTRNPSGLKRNMQLGFLR